MPTLCLRILHSKAAFVNQLRFLLSKLKTPGCLPILSLGTRCVHTLKENQQIEKSLSLGTISDVYLAIWKPVPKISPEVFLFFSLSIVSA